MEIKELQDRLLMATLPHVAFDGWSPKAMREGARDAQMDATMPERLFPKGAAQMVAHFCDYADRQMIAGMAALDSKNMRLRDKVVAAIRLRLEHWAPEREAVRRAVTLFSLPQNAGLAARCTWNTTDAIWHMVGDKSADFSYYTKRASLAAIYGSTLLVWMDDKSENFQDTWDFLDRRIGDIMLIPKTRAKLREAAQRIPNSLRLLPRPRRVFRDNRLGR